MKRKRINYSSIIYVLVGFFIVLGVFSQARGQRYPIALQQKPITGNQKAIDCTNTASDPTIGYLSPGNKEYYQCLASTYRQNPNRADRDRLIFMAITQIDINFKNYRKDRRKLGEYFQIVMDFLRIGATTAAAITNGERAKSVIANIATLLLGTGDSVNKNFRFLEQQMLFNKMESERDKVMLLIFAQIRNDIDVYPFERAFIDIFDYYEAGTMTGALTKLGSDTGAEARDVARLLSDVKAALSPSSILPNSTPAPSATPSTAPSPAPSTAPSPAASPTPAASPPF